MNDYTCRDRLRLFDKNGVFIFSLLKYAEFIFIALTSIILARQIGPVEMRYSIPVFLYITYSNYLCLGVNSVILKRYGLLNKIEQDDLFCRVFHLTCVACLGTFLLSLIVLECSYALLAAGVSIMVFLRSYFLTYYRLKGRMFVINVNSIMYAFLFFILTITYVHTFKAYMICWNIALISVLFLYFFSDLKHLKKYISLKHIEYSWKKYKSIVSMGIKLSFMTIMTTIFLTNDKFFIDKFPDISDSLKGSYQLADNIGVALYMIVTTIMYYYYPTWMVKLRSFEFLKLYIKRIGFLLLALPFVVFVTWSVTYYIALWLFPAYDSLDVFVPAIVCYKLLIIALSLFSTICIVYNKEMKYVFSSLFVLMLIIGCNFLLIWMRFSLVSIPIIASVFILFYIIWLIFRVNIYVS